MKRVPKGLVEETKAMVRMYLFLRHDCGLKYAERLGARELREVIKGLRLKQEKG